jgi:hypothetical protein
MKQDKDRKKIINNNLIKNFFILETSFVLILILNLVDCERFLFQKTYKLNIKLL